MLDKNNILAAYKPLRLPYFYSLLFDCLLEVCDTNGFIPFPQIRSAFSIYKIRRRHLFPILKDLQELGVIKISPYRGIIIVLDSEQRSNIIKKKVLDIES